MNVSTCWSILRDGRIQHDQVLAQEAHELAKIFARSVHTARANTTRLNDLSNG